MSPQLLLQPSLRPERAERLRVRHVQVSEVRKGVRVRRRKPEEFDSDIESEFARKWGGEPRDGWSLAREADILHSDQRVFVPDFTFRHADGRKVLLEIVGFGTADYLTAKLRTLRLFSSTPILLAVAERLTDQLPPLPPKLDCVQNGSEGE